MYLSLEKTVIRLFYIHYGILYKMEYLYWNCPEASFWPNFCDWEINQFIPHMWDPVTFVN